MERVLRRIMGLMPLKSHISNISHMSHSQNIFDLIIGQLAHIGDTTGAYFPNHLYLLESLSTVKSIVLMVDLPNADGYLRRIFTDFFENIR